MSKIAAVIPAFDEVRTIRDVAERTLRETPWLIVVDDGSIDGTADALAGLPLTLLRNQSNLGKALSLMRAFEHALELDAEAIVTLDGDGQHRPEDIPRLLAAHLHLRRALVIGSRLHNRRQIPRERYLANRFANFWIAWAAGQRVADSQSGFRVYPSTLLRAVKLNPDRAKSFVFESEIVIEAGRHGVPIVSVPIAAIYPDPDRARRSHFRPVLDIARIVRMVAWKLASGGLHLQGLVRSLRGAGSGAGDSRSLEHREVG